MLTEVDHLVLILSSI